MKFIFLCSLIALLLGVFIVMLIQSEPGYVLIAIGGYTLESSVWFLFSVLFVSFICITFFIGLVTRLIQSHGRFRDWLDFRGSKRSAKLINGGIINWIEGNWETSRGFFLKSAKYSESPLLNYLMAARVSHKLGENERMYEYLKAAQKSDGEAVVAIELTQAEMLLEAQQYEQALATLVRARRNADRHPYVLELLCKVYLGLKDWENLLKLLEDLKRYEVLGASKLNEVESQVYFGLLHLRLDSDDPLKELISRWERFPIAIRRHKPLVFQYASLLINNSGHELAEEIIFFTLKQDWDSSFLRLIPLLAKGDFERRYKTVKSWLPDNGDDLDLLFCLGKLAIRLKLLKEAETYFLKSLSISPSSEIYSELGKLFASQGHLEESIEYFQKGTIS